MKSAHYAVFLGVCLIAGATAAQDAPASNAAQAESREGLPDTYTGPVSAVAAIVDDKVITTFDVDQRTLMMIIGSGRDAPPDMIPQLRERALKDLVDESLKLNEVKKMEVTVDDAEIEDELKAIASSGGLDVDGLEKCSPHKASRSARCASKCAPTSPGRGWCAAAMAAVSG